MEDHCKGGSFTWDPAKVALHLEPGQKPGKSVKGKALREALKSRHPFNANMLDYLLAHPYLIPEEWKTKAVFFWGTIYRGSGGFLCVRCLGLDGASWYWSGNWLGDVWNAYNTAAVPAS